MSVSEARVVSATSNKVKAADVVKQAAKHMDDRASTYDAPSGERSMANAVTMFNILTDSAISEEQGWMFMAILKMVRSQQGQFKLDNYEDGAAYFALAAEIASQRRL